MEKSFTAGEMALDFHLDLRGNVLDLVNPSSAVTHEVSRNVWATRIRPSGLRSVALCIKMRGGQWTEPGVRLNPRSDRYHRNLLV